jgi:hypothetical protein
MKKADIPTLIRRGEFDDHLVEILYATQDRRKYVRKTQAEETAGKLKKGTQVRIKEIRPAYLNGYEATVIVPRTPKKHGFCQVDLNTDLPRIRRYPTKGLLVPHGSLEIIE